jgi:hypothetical protein
VIEAGLRVAVDDPSDDVGQVPVRLDGEQLAGFDQRGDDRPMLGAAVGAGEQSVLAVEGQRADGALDDVIVDFDLAIVEEQRKPSPARQGVADRLGQLGLLADQRQLLAQPRLQRGQAPPSTCRMPRKPARCAIGRAALRSGA